MGISGASYLCIFGHRVLKDHIFPTQPAVDRSVGVQLVFGVVPLLWVQEDLDDLGTIQTVPDSLPHNLSWEDNILQDAIVDSSQSPGARALNS